MLTRRFGMLFSLKDLTSKLSPDSQGLDHLHTVKTNSFTLHHYQSPSGLMFVLNTAADIPGASFACLSARRDTNTFFFLHADLHANLQHVYAQIYVECIARNPLYRHKPDEPIRCPLFVLRLEDYLFSLVKQ
jgi:hypothetical protein